MSNSGCDDADGADANLQARDRGKAVPDCWVWVFAGGGLLGWRRRNELALSPSNTRPVHDKPAILLRLPEYLSAQLFAGAKPSPQSRSDTFCSEMPRSLEPR